MKTNQPSQLRQYARVARVFPKTLLSSTYSRIRVLVATKSQE